MNPYHEHHIVGLRRRIMTTRYMHKRIYKYPRYESTIPAKYKDLAEEFMNRNSKSKPKKKATT